MPMDMSDDDSRGRSRSASPVREDMDDSRQESPMASSGEAAGRPAARSAGVQTEVKPSNILGVFGLHFETREPDLERIFEQFGVIEACSVVIDRRTGQSRCFGFITFDTVESAAKALEATNGREVMGRSIRVDFSKTERPHEPTPGKYLGERPERHIPERRPYGDRGGADRGYDRGGDRGGDRGYDRGGYARRDYYDRDRGYGGYRDDRYRDERPSYGRYDRGYAPPPLDYGRPSSYDRPPYDAPRRGDYPPGPPRYESGPPPPPTGGYPRDRSRSPPRYYR